MGTEGSERKRKDSHAKAAQFSPAEAALWAVYKADRSVANRNALVEFYLPLLRVIAGKIADKLPPLSYADLRSDGVFGLIRAVERFDPARGLKFTTFAPLLIRGSILDANRQRDDVPRLVRGRAALIVAVERGFQQRHQGKLPTARQLAYALKKPMETLAAWRREIAAMPKMESLFGRPLEGDNGKLQTVIDRTVDPAATPPEANVALLEWWCSILRPLSRVQRVLLVLYYHYGLHMWQIGDHLGMSESRISQLHSETIAFLKKSREPTDFTDIKTRGVSIKWLRHIFPYCRRRRLKLRSRGKPVRRNRPA